MTDNDQAQLEAAVMELVEERDSSVEQHGYASVPPPRQHAQRIIERIDELRAKPGKLESSGWPNCPTCGEPAATQVAQDIGRREPGAFRDVHEAGQVTSQCPNGHWFNEAGEVPGPPPDVRITP